jgi:hypothetical protein
MQFEMGMSTRRYFPPSGTAGFARSFVNGNSLVPAPPPKITDSTLAGSTDKRLDDGSIMAAQFRRSLGVCTLW